MKLIAGGSPKLPAFRTLRTSGGTVTTLSTKVQAYSQAGAAPVSIRPVESDLAISVDNLGVGFGVAGARKQV